MKFSLYSKKNRLDEMQEQTMRKIESHGFWLLWGSLLAAWIVQTVFGAADKAAGEWVVFMIGCIYMVVACLRNGLWDRHLSDKAPANAVYSLVAAVAVTLICGFSYGYWVGAVFAGVFTGILCFFLWILGRCCFCRCFYRHPVLCIAATVRRIDTQTARASG